MLNFMKDYNDCNVWLHPRTASCLLQRERTTFPTAPRSVDDFLSRFASVSGATTVVDPSSSARVVKLSNRSFHE